MKQCWHEKRGLDPFLGFPAGQPLVISGGFGKGRYLLSYAHLETPESPAANAWFAELLAGVCGVEASGDLRIEWSTGRGVARPEHISGNFRTSLGFQQFMGRAHAAMAQLMALAAELRLFFPRNSWLWGWQSGFPGLGCNGLLAALSMIYDMPDARPPALWLEKGRLINELFSQFLELAETWFWDCRLEAALTPRESMPETNLEQRRRAIFGHSMSGGGLIQEIADMVEELVFQCQESVLNRPEQAD